jgi:hypothetical protein
MNAARIIEALGDTSEVAAALGISLPAVSNMKIRGIPRSQMLAIHELAVRKGIKAITAEVIRRAGAPRRVAA